ncbi:MAG TPA: RNA methyltransferase [Cyclobacteriaceae bacterium]|nr:RNA methyltransferase [Cyclobacteriaceae bacterium]
MNPLTDFLGQYITDNRKATIEKVLDNRTRYMTLVLEDIYQSQNASAVVRTCECMGIQDLHIVESKSKYSVNKKVLMGSNKWMNLIRYKEKELGKTNISACYAKLKSEGYRIVATHPAAGISIDELSIDSKIAVVMGNELKGITKFALDNADELVRIPMFGFTESMNISVSAAICIRSLVSRIRASGTAWKLSDTEKDILRLEWYRKSLKQPAIMEKDFQAKGKLNT